MLFTRTDNGLSNQSLFYDGADFTVYLEGGGGALNFQDVLAGNFNKRAIDYNFWKAIFRSFNFTKKIHFKAVGSKSVLKEISQRIVSGNVTGVIVAMDRDYDIINNTSISHPNIIYSYGYSWENDIWQKGIIKSYITDIGCWNNLPKDMSEKVDLLYERFYADAVRLSTLQYEYVNLGIEFLPLQKLQSLYKMNPEPQFNKNQLLKFIQAASAIRKKRRTSGNYALRKHFDITGKIYREFGFLVLKRFKDTVGGFAFVKDTLDSSLISHSMSLDAMGFNRRQIRYYSNMCSLLNNLST